MVLVLICGGPGCGGLAGARDARRRGRDPIKGFLLGVFLGPIGHHILRHARSGRPLPDHVQVFFAVYRLLWLFVLSLLNSARLIFGG